MYGSAITLTFQGKDKFRTQFGAMVTIFIAVLLTSYGLIQST